MLEFAVLKYSQQFSYSHSKASSSEMDWNQALVFQYLFRRYWILASINPVNFFLLKLYSVEIFLSMENYASSRAYLSGYHFLSLLFVIAFELFSNLL